MAIGDFLKKAAEKGADLAKEAKKFGTELAANLTTKYGTVKSGKHEGCQIALGNPPGSSIVSNTLSQIIFLDGTEEIARYNIKELEMVRDMGLSKEDDFRQIIKIEYSDGDFSNILLNKENNYTFKSQVLWYSKFKNKLKAEEEAAEKEKQEREHKEKIANALKPSCEKGDCLWNNEKFYYICDECIECNRKTSTKKMQGKVKYPQLWKYMKRYEQSEKDMMEKSSDLAVAKDYFLEKNGVTLEEGDTNNGYRDTGDISSMAAYDVLVKKREEIGEAQDKFASELFEEFMPVFAGNKLAELYVNYNGINNPFFDLLWDIKDLGIELSIRKTHILSDEKIDFSDDLGSIPLALECDLYRNPSLYDRSDDDFIYTLKAILVTLMGDDDTIEKFFDDDGNILPAGIGGPKQGFYDPCIWSIIQEKMDENEDE